MDVHVHVVFDRLLANWCYDSRHREDSDTWTATGSKVCSEFSSCVNIKIQHRPYNLSKNLCRNKKKCKKTSSKIISQRNNGLSYFLRLNERFKKNYQDPSQENTLKLLVAKIVTILFLSYRAVFFFLSFSLFVYF